MSGGRRGRSPDFWRIAALLLLIAAPVRAGAPAFELVTLGANGGLSDGNLSAWLVRASDDHRYLALDAGSLLPGIERALRQGAFKALLQTPAADPQLTPAGRVLREGIAGYFISHAHLDHLAGMLIVSPDDSAKPIYALASTLQTLTGSYFNWQAWANFSDQGPEPRLKRYTLRAPPPGETFAIDGTTLQAQLLPLAHDRLDSSMILLRTGAPDTQRYLAYFGDTGADATERSTRLAAVWQVLAPLQRRGALAALIIECSYPDATPDERLYGHFKPVWLLQELRRFEQAAGGDGALRGLDVVISHIKPSLRRGESPRALIAAQLAAGNALPPGLGLRLHYPQQGERLLLPGAR